MFSIFRREAEPHGCEHAENMSVRKDERVAVDPLAAINHATNANGNLFRVLAVWASILKERPVRIALVNLFRRESFVVSVVPLKQIVRVLRLWKKPSEFAGSNGAQEWTRQHKFELRGVSEHEFTRSERFRLATGQQRQVRAPGVLPRQTPFGFGVPHEHEVFRHPRSVLQHITSTRSW